MAWGRFNESFRKVLGKARRTLWPFPGGNELGGLNGVIVTDPPVSGSSSILLEGGSSYLVLEDGASRLLLE